MCPELHFHGDSKPYRVDNYDETLTAGLPFQRNEDKAIQKRILLGCQHSRMNLVNTFKHRGAGDSFLKYPCCKERVSPLDVPFGARELVLWLRAIAALIKDSGMVLSTHMVAHNTL